MAFSTAYDLLQERLEREPLYKKGHFRLVDFSSADSGHHYIAMVNTDKLQRETALTPVRYGALEYNFGQPLVVDTKHLGEKYFSPAVTFMAKVPGADLESMLDDTAGHEMRPLERLQYPHRPSDVAIFEEIANLPPFTFQQFMQHKRHLMEQGLGGDNRRGNWMVDPIGKRLNELDVVEHENRLWHNHNIEDVLRGFGLNHAHDRDAIIGERRNTALARIRANFQEAGHAAGIPATRAAIEELPVPAFVRTDLTQQLGQFSLANAPKQLTELFAEMEARFHIR